MKVLLIVMMTLSSNVFAGELPAQAKERKVVTCYQGEAYVDMAVEGTTILAANWINADWGAAGNVPLPITTWASPNQAIKLKYDGKTLTVEGQNAGSLGGSYTCR